MNTYEYLLVEGNFSVRISHTANDEAGRYEGIPLAFMSYAQRRVEWLVLAIPLAKRSQTLSCSGIIRTCCRCLKYYLTAKNTASPANSPSWLDLDYVPLLINGELPALTATTGAVYWPNRMGGGGAGGEICSSIKLFVEWEPVSRVWSWLSCIHKGLTRTVVQKKDIYELFIYMLRGLNSLFWRTFLSLSM